MLRVDRGGDPEKVSKLLPSFLPSFLHSHSSVQVRESQRRRFASVELVDQVISLDDTWRKLTGEIDRLKKSKNAVQKEVGIKKKAGQECDAQVAEIQSIGVTIEAKEKEQDETKALLDSLLGKIGG